MTNAKIRKITAPLCALLALALLLCACAGKDVSAPDGASSSLPDGDSGTGADAPSAPRTLTEEEMAELWERLGGCCWELESPQADRNDRKESKMFFQFTRRENEYWMQMALRASEGESLRIGSVTEQDGVYTCSASEWAGFLSFGEYEEGAGETVSLLLGEDDVLTLTISTPPRYGTATSIVNEEGDEFGGMRWRPATEEEISRAQESGTDGYLNLESGDSIDAGGTYGPVRYVRDSIALPEGAHWLSAEEASAVWNVIEGQWIPADESMWDGTSDSRYCPVYEISHSGNSYGSIKNFSAFGSEGKQWSFRAVAEWEDGYVLEAMSESTWASFTDCYPGGGTQFFLKIVGDELQLSWSQLAYVWWREKPAPDPPAYNFARMPTEEELDKLAHAEDGATSMWLSDNSAIVGEYHREPILLRRTTGEELESIGNWYVNALG